MQPLFYRPADSVVADIIPLARPDGFHLFYLRDWRDHDARGEGVPWWHLRTTDFATYEDLGEALPRGAGRFAVDGWVFTGCALERDGRTHLFYTGHNHHRIARGEPQEVVLHAVSTDGVRFAKDPVFALAAPADYEPHDWRDPFVFFNDEAGEYWMLLAARRRVGPPRHRGCVALLTSPDLVAWTVRDPLWAPQRWSTHECPDLFRIGGWWYLVFSEFSEATVTRYRMARSLAGPWVAPADDRFDARGWYAAKSAAGADGRRFLFGWLASKEGQRDDRGWQWGGNLVAHELTQRDDGTLAVTPPRGVVDAFAGPPASPTPRAVLGDWRLGPGSAACDARGGFAAALAGEMPATCLVEAAFAHRGGAGDFGLLLRADANLDPLYQIRFEPTRGRVVVDRWPRPGDQPFLLERPLTFAAGTAVRVRALVEGSCLVVYLDGGVALSCRLYDHRVGQVGVFAQDAAIEVSGLSVRAR